MISHILDLTDQFNANDGILVDVSLYETVSFQFVTPSGTINITGSNDSGAITGISDGGPSAATNFTAIQMVNLSATATPVSTVAAAGIYKFTVACKYVKFAGVGVTAAKVLLFGTKPY